MLPLVQAVDISHASVFSTATTLGSLLWAAILRATGRTGCRNFALKSRSSRLETSMTRVPISELPTIGSKYGNPAKLKNSYNLANQAIPQRLIEESLPRVHHRLPDAILWNKIKEELKQEEKNFSFPFEDSASRRKRTVPEKQPALRSKSPHKTKRRSQPELEGVLRRRQLYCRTGFHIQVLPNGRVTGTGRDHDVHAILEFISVDVGQIAIRGVASGKYLSMDGQGRLYGSDYISHESTFHETLQENWYNSYSSTKHRNRTRSCFIALNRNGKPRRWCRGKANPRFTHFLPRPVDPKKVPNLYKGILY